MKAMWRSALLLAVLAQLLACAGEPRDTRPATRPPAAKAPAPAPAPNRVPEGSRDVVQALNAIAQAYLAGDAAALEVLLTEDYELTNASGEITTRADEIENARTGYVRYQRFEFADLEPRVYGDAAVVRGRLIMKGQAGTDFFDAEFQFTNTLVWQNGRWRLAATHVSRLRSDLRPTPP